MNSLNFNVQTNYQVGMTINVLDRLVLRIEETEDVGIFKVRRYLGRGSEIVILGTLSQCQVCVQVLVAKLLNSLVQVY